MKRFAILIIIVSINFINLNAGNDSLLHINRIGYGLNAGVGYNMYSANFREIPSHENCCPQFSTGSGFGYSFSGLFSYPLYDKLYITGRLGIAETGGTLTELENSDILINDVPAIGQDEHTIRASLMKLHLQPVLGYAIYKNLFVNIGFDLGFFLSNSFEQKEQLVKPADRGVFTDTKSRMRNVQSYTLKTMSNPDLSLIGGLSYHLPLNASNELFLSPEIMYSLGMTNIISGISWKINILKFGVSLIYYPLPPKVEERIEQAGLF